MTQVLDGLSLKGKFKKLKSPPEKIDLASCYFYHTMELPGCGVIRGDWDIRGYEQGFLGDYDFFGKTVFDVGTATGYLCFEMIKRGAHVVPLDQDETADTEFSLIPYFDYQRRFGMSIEDRIAGARKHVLASRSAFLFSQRRLGVEAPIYLGDVMKDTPPMEADAALFGNVLLHLRDPVAALLNVARKVREAVIVTELTISDAPSWDTPPYLLFRPSLTPPSTPVTWWYLSPALIRRVLEVAGFKRFELTTGKMMDGPTSTEVPIYNITAYRM